MKPEDGTIPACLGEPMSPLALLSSPQLQAEDGISEKARQTALCRHALVVALDSYRGARSQQSAAHADKEFLAGYNAGLTYKNIHAVLGEVSRPTIYRWKQLLDGTHDWTRLAPQYNRPQAPRLNPVEERVYLGFLLSPNKISIGTATRLTKLLLRNRGLESTKSDMTFRRYAEDFTAKNYDTWILMREGQKALKDKVAPYIKRDPSVLSVGDVLVADGHRLNFNIVNPFTGKPCRGTIIAYIDWKSKDLAGYDIAINGNTQVVASAMRNSIVSLGRIPKVGYQDNGKEFKNRFFLGSASFEEEGFGGLFGRLGIIPVFAAPYNARAKIIERWFREFSNSFERLIPSYTGASIDDKPAYMMRNEKFHKALHNEYVPTIGEVVQLLDFWLEFHRSQECPHEKGKSIGQVFQEGKGPGVDTSLLDDLMMDEKITRIDRNGIRFLGQDYYDDNLYGLKEQVMIRYSLFDLSYVKVYAQSGEFICTADRVMAVHPMARVLGTPKDVEAVKRGISLQRRAEKKTMQGARELVHLRNAAQVDWQKVAEISPRMIDRMIEQEIELPAAEVSIPEECIPPSVIPACPESRAEIVRLEPQTRPHFENGIERYQWHLDFGVFTEEDAAWCQWFRTTNDFKMLFSYEKEGREVSS